MHKNWEKLLQEFHSGMFWGYPNGLKADPMSDPEVIKARPKNA
jgi:hypothetical protein